MAARGALAGAAGRGAGDRRSRAGSLSAAMKRSSSGRSSSSRCVVLGKTRRVHFVGIGGIGMSGIAELLANLGYVGQRIGREAHRAVTDRLGDARHPRRRRARRGERRRRGRRGRLVGGAADEPGGRRGGAPADSGDSARRDARGADAAPLRDRGRRRARQDDDDVDDRAGARAGRARSDGGDRRAAERLRQQRAARAAAS